MSNIPANKYNLEQGTKGYICIIGMIVLIIMPNILYLFLGQNADSILRKLGILTLSVSMLTAPFLLFVRNIRVYFILLFPFALLSPLSMYFIYLYKNHLKIGVLGAIFETTFNEAAEFIYGSKGAIAVALLFMILFGCIYRYQMKLVKKRINTYIAIIITITSILFITIIYFVPSFERHDNRRLKRSDIFERRIMKTYPIGLVINGVQYLMEINRINNHQNIIKNASLDVLKTNNERGKEIFVLILGESARYDHFSINGYHRNASKYLQSTAAVTSFTNVCAPGTTTRFAIPLLLTTVGVNNYHSSYSVPSVITFFKSAGYETYWISTQKKIGKYDTPISVFANEADYIQYLTPNIHSQILMSELDEAILTPLSKILSESLSNKIFVIAHTMGSHWKYDLRYPEHFDVFKPSMKEIRDIAIDDASPRSKEIKINSYDNSIAYTDYFISLVINKIASLDIVGAVLYISDHGQDLLDDERNLFGQGNSDVTKHVAHVPLFVWLSDQYRAAFPHKADAVVNNSKMKISGDYLFHSLLDMADIRYKEEDLSRSIFSSSLTPRKRHIISIDYKLIDCDKLL